MNRPLHQQPKDMKTETPFALLRKRIPSLEKSLGKGDATYALETATLLENGVPAQTLRGVYEYFRHRGQDETGKPAGKASKEVADLLYRAMYKEQTQQ